MITDGLVTNTEGGYLQSLKCRIYYIPYEAFIGGGLVPNVPSNYIGYSITNLKYSFSVCLDDLSTNRFLLYNSKTILSNSQFYFQYSMIKANESEISDYSRYTNVVINDHLWKIYYVDDEMTKIISPEISNAYTIRVTSSYIYPEIWQTTETDGIELLNYLTNLVHSSNDLKIVTLSNPIGWYLNRPSQISVLTIP